MTPRIDPLVYGLIRPLAPLILAMRDRIVALEIDPQSRARLEALRGRPALLLPNHPSETEPPVLTALSFRLREPLYFVATHELFHGPVGWLVRRMGVFAIRRGRPDRAALRECVELLRGGRKLVLFPEGETHLRHDQILSLHRGAAQVARWAREAGADPALVPIVIRYRCAGDPTAALRRGADRLERALGRGVSTEPLPARLRACGLAILEAIEREYGGSGAGSVDERIGRVYGRIEARVCQSLGIAPPVGRTISGRMRSLFNQVEAFELRGAGAAGAYARRLAGQRRTMARALRADLWRVQNFMAMDGGALPDDASAERLAEMLLHFEIEVFGRGLTRPGRIAQVRVGEPLERADGGRRDELTAVTARIEAALWALLERG